MGCDREVVARNQGLCRRGNECYILEELEELNATKSLTFIFLLVGASDWIISRCNECEYNHLLFFGLLCLLLGDCSVQHKHRARLVQLIAAK